MTSEEHPLQETLDSVTICPEWKQNIGEVLFSEAQIKKRVEELAAKLTEEYKGKDVLVVGLLNGALVFVADVLRHVGFKHQVDFMVASSYGHGTTSSGSIKLKKDLNIDPAGRDILIIEDLIDTGHTLKWIIRHLESKNVKSIKICCLLDKKERREVDVDIHFCGFQCPDKFVVGYGMDFADEYRCIPFIGVLKPEAYQS